MLFQFVHSLKCLYFYYFFKDISRVSIEKFGKRRHGLKKCGLGREWCGGGNVYNCC